MTSQITKDFQMKSKLRKLADGGSPKPETPGTGAVARAGGLLAGRGRQIDDAVGAATGAPAPAPQQVTQAPKKSGLRRMFGFADGGSYLDDGYNANRYQQSQLKDGGRVKGPGGRTDDKVGPVMLSDEEYVLPGDTADAIGRDKLDAIRLATHDFKDGRKESALRGRTDDVPIDHLADGGPGYQQPRLPPPQPGTAVQVARPPMGRRPPIDMGMVEEVPRSALRAPTGPTAQPWSGAPPTNPNVGPAGSKEAQAFRNAAGSSFGDAAAAGKGASLTQRAGGALRTTGSVLSKVAGAVGAGMAAKDMYDNGINVGNSGDLLASGAAFAGPVGAAGAAGWGVGRAIGNNLSEDTRDLIGGTINQGVRNVGKFFGQDWGVDDSALLRSKAEARLAAARKAASPAAAVAPAGASALRSDQGPAQPVAPGLYQSRRLSEMGVPLDVQNSPPVVDSALRGTQGVLKTGGTDKFQNLGTYGGNANIYGRSSDPSRPGRINEFVGVGVGAGASPENEYSGSGSGGAIRSTAASALRGYGGEAAQPDPQPVQPMANNRSRAVDEINARYNRLLEGGRGKAVEFGSDWSQRHGIALEKARGDELSSVLNNENTNATSRANAQLSAETLRSNAELNARVQMADVQSRMEQNRATISAQAQAAQLKALQDAQKYSDERQDKGEAATRDWIKDRFTSLGSDDKQVFDSGGAAKFTDFLGSGKAMVGPPENRRPLMSLPPQERLAALPEVYQDWSVNEAMNSGGGLIGGGRTTNSPGKLVARPATVADLANGLPLGEYLGTKLVPGYESNVVERATDRKVRSMEAIAGDDLERKKAIIRNAGKE